MTAQIFNALKTRQPEIERFMRALVETESPSGDLEGSRAVVDLLVQAASGLECISDIKRETVPGFGEHLVIRAFEKTSDAKQILIVGHTDTVHARGSVDERPWRTESGRIYGPGIFDMKANCALAIEVLRVLAALKATPECAVTVVLTCDEEVGSQTGWPLMRELASERQTRCAFVLEPPASGGRVKTSRKGTGIFAIKVEGKAAHAGLEPEKGASAILELA